MAKKRSTLLHAMIAVFALVALESKSWAQLDSSCTVSALNRTAPVQEDGAWVLPNVPANVGQVRVRATCVDNGVVRSGASSLVTVPANGIIKVDDIVFQGPPPVPSSLTVSRPLTSLTAVGQTVQLFSVALYWPPSWTDANSAAITSPQSIGQLSGLTRILE